MTATPPAVSPLARKLAGAAPNATPAPSVSGSALARRKATAGQRGEYVTLPVLGRVYIELPGARAWQEAEAAVARELRRLEVSEDTLRGVAMRESEMALRILSISARDPDDHAVAFGSLEEWGDLDNDIVGIAWHAFVDVRFRLDPVEFGLSEDEMVAIASAVKKKDPALLRTFGVVRLSVWLATTGGLPSTSPTPSSPSTDSDSGSTRPSMEPDED